MKNGDTRPKKELTVPRLGVCWCCSQRRRLSYRLRDGRFTLCAECAVRGMEYVHGMARGSGW